MILGRVGKQLEKKERDNIFKDPKELYWITRS
jgi:hypothetical protein